ncbi:MAG: peptidoglycan DD-metalloendopeptidase family protein [Solirubrobacteraceae bacterium]
MKRKLVLAGVAATLMGMAIVPSAQAAPRDGICQKGEFCLYFNSDHKGSVSDFAPGSISDYGARQPTCYEYKGRGRGRGTCVKNEAAAAWNRTGKPATIFFNSGFKGATQVVPPGGKVNLSPTLKNENAGHRIGDVDVPAPVDPGSRKAMSFALYHQAGGRVTCAYNGYTTTKGKHEGIDFARGIGTPVHALLAGRVVLVEHGADGGRLSTISIHNEQLNRTIVYLHAAPVAGLKAKRRIKRGQRIATEAWRGITHRRSAHTHVEMRVGKRDRAAKSVDDYRLDNPSPAGFWVSQGYSVR